MRGDKIEFWPFNAEEAADILNWSRSQFALWTKRYAPFPHKQQGRGFSISYTLSDLMKLAAIAELVRADLPPEKAFGAFSYGSPYGAMLHDAPPYEMYPGTVTFTKNSEGRWLPVDRPDSSVAIKVRSWAIFDRLWPKIKSTILANPRRLKLADVKAALKEYEESIKSIRNERWKAN